MKGKKRPAILKGTTEKMQTGCGSLYLTINQDEEEKVPYELRLQMGKSGSCIRSMLEVIGILMSIIFQNVDRDIAVKSLKKHLRGVNCDTDYREGDKRFSSCLDKIAQKVLEELKEE